MDRAAYNSALADAEAAVAAADAMREAALRNLANLRHLVGLDAPGAPERGPSANLQWPPRLDTIALNDGGWMTIGQAATFLRLSECTIRRHKHEVGVKLGRVWWINKARLVAHFAAKAQ